MSAGIQSELDLINRVFADGQQSDEQILQKVAQLYEEGEENIYARVLHVMCHLRLGPKEAQQKWQAILEHQKKLERTLQRSVGFRVALLDYFVNQSRDIKNPKVIEIHIYAETARQVATDELTGIYNRRFFDQALIREFKQAQRHHREFSLLVLDIDNFKRINDTYGHTTGDAVIAALGQLLRQCTRSEDTPCRIGGEEFAVLLPETGADGAIVVGEKIRKEFSQLKIATLTLSLSGGIATYPVDATKPEDLLDRADQMLYFAKYSGKNRVICYSRNKRRHVRFPLEWELTLSRPEGSRGKTRSQDVSIEGISFELDEPAEPGELMSLHLNIDSEPMELPVQIVWVDNNSQNRKFRAGARFIRLTEKNLTALRQKLPNHGEIRILR
ncbi:MAG: diguanylate cyclase [Turneriella sp.]|nr:diguanylate cyclase [Leptospiraceae bacterium]MCX7633494.1 diguanylate cyclase [Turneriella sp.]